MLLGFLASEALARKSVFLTGLKADPTSLVPLSIRDRKHRSVWHESLVARELFPWRSF
jgi:hypothetical protein